MLSIHLSADIKYRVMKPRDVEIWALNVLAQIDANTPYETALVELKADWPDVQKTARRIAGHANAARGNNILWLIGVDEKRGILGAPPNNLANWYSQVRAEFDHVAPDVTDVAVDWNGKTVFALGFETDRAPYVAKNPKFNQQGGGSVRLEVPWRQGTAVDSATHAQLLLILSPSTRLPYVELLQGQLAVEMSTAEGEQWNLSMLLYVTPATRERVVFSGHRIIATHQAIGGDQVGPYTGEVTMFPMGRYGGSYKPFTQAGSLHPTISSTNFDLTIDGPGLINVIVKTRAQRNEMEPLSADRMGVLKITPARADLPIVVTATFKHAPRSDWPQRWLTANYANP